jgi:hypothetical protein
MTNEEWRMVVSLRSIIIKIDTIPSFDIRHSPFDIPTIGGNYVRGKKGFCGKGSSHFFAG